MASSLYNDAYNEVRKQLEALSERDGGGVSDTDLEGHTAFTYKKDGETIHRIVIDDDESGILLNVNGNTHPVVAENFLGDMRGYIASLLQEPKHLVQHAVEVEPGLASPTFETEPEAELPALEEVKAPTQFTESFLKASRELNELIERNAEDLFGIPYTKAVWKNDPERAQEMVQNVSKYPYTDIIPFENITNVGAQRSGELTNEKYQGYDEAGKLKQVFVVRNGERVLQTIEVRHEEADLYASEVKATFYREDGQVKTLGLAYDAKQQTYITVGNTTKLYNGSLEELFPREAAPKSAAKPMPVEAPKEVADLPLAAPAFGGDDEEIVDLDDGTLNLGELDDADEIILEDDLKLPPLPSLGPKQASESYQAAIDALQEEMGARTNMPVDYFDGLYDEDDELKEQIQKAGTYAYQNHLPAKNVGMVLSNRYDLLDEGAPKFERYIGIYPAEEETTLSVLKQNGKALLKQEFETYGISGKAVTFDYSEGDKKFFAVLRDYGDGFLILSINGSKGYEYNGAPEGVGEFIKSTMDAELGAQKVEAVAPEELTDFLDEDEPTLDPVPAPAKKKASAAAASEPEEPQEPKLPWKYRSNAHYVADTAAQVMVGALTKSKNWRGKGEIYESQDWKALNAPSNLGAKAAYGITDGLSNSSLGLLAAGGLLSMVTTAGLAVVALGGAGALLKIARSVRETKEKGVVDAFTNNTTKMDKVALSATTVVGVLAGVVMAPGIAAALTVTAAVIGGGYMMEKSGEKLFGGFKGFELPKMGFGMPEEWKETGSALKDLREAAKQQYLNQGRQ